MSRHLSRIASAATAALALAFAAPAASRADTAVIVPGLAAAEGNSTYTFAGDLTSQELISTSVLGAITPGSTITGVAFRLNGTQAAVNTPITFGTFDIRLGGSTVAALAEGQSFAANMAADTVLVRSGSLTFAAGSFASGGSPNAFGPVINFTTPFTYTGGNLLFTFSFTAPSVIFDADAALQNAAGVDYLQGSGGTGGLRVNNTTIAAQFQFTPGAVAVPEASTLALALPALGMVGAIVIKRRKK